MFLKLPFEGNGSIKRDRSGIEDHTTGPTNVREHCPEDDLTLGKNMLLEVDSLVE